MSTLAPTTRTSKPAARKQSKLATLFRFDQNLLAELAEDYHLIGLDEVGRGSLIGSVVGGAACLPKKLSREQKQCLSWLDDSKKLTPSIRAELSDAIHQFCLTGLGVADKAEVDEMNIHYASLLALYRALQQLCERAGLCVQTGNLLVIMDGRATIPDFRPEIQKAIVKGDGCSAAIAAASVIAKHHRDAYVKALAQEYPGYGWEQNMGYPTPAHLEGLRTLGLTPLHRRNFKKVHEQLKLPLG